MGLIDKLSAIGDAIREKTGGTELLTLEQMPIEIAAITTGGGGEDVEIPVITGNCQYRFASNGWNWFIEAYGNKMRTEDISNSSEMFFNSDKLTEIPFDFNFKPSTSSSDYYPLDNMFYNCSLLTEIPAINDAFPDDFGGMFKGCQNVRYLPEDLGENWKWDRIHTYKYASIDGLFYDCKSLRKIPENFLKNLYTVSTSSGYQIYKEGFYFCHNLNEICGLPISPGPFTSNCFSNTFNACCNLRKITFETNEDGSPKVVQWKSQTIDLSGHIGYIITYSFSGGRTAYVYNSGRTIDKAIYNEETYQALKNDPDAFVSVISGEEEKPEYFSFYNKVSAIETINSLPDTSAYGTNTIKFKGEAGSKTDGGAINTMTEEEIAVAAAKGWTVSFV